MMPNRGLLVACQVLAVLCLASFVLADNAVVGVGGFVRVSPELSKFLSGKLDVTQIRVKLVTAEGREKGSSECAPNGYYFIPIYDPGSYFVVAEGPAGWNFSPSRVPILPGRDSDEDVDFALTGFRLAGRASSTCAGPVADVEFSLEADSLVRSTRSRADGVFEFTDVLPGTYLLRAQRDGWSIDTPVRQLSLGWGGGELSESYAVTGYDVRGSVSSRDGPAPHITVVLYGPRGAQPPAGCAQPAADVPLRDGQEPLCVTTTGSDGAFSFVGVPCGTYTVAPLPARGRAAFDVVPQSASVTVKGSASAGSFRVERFAAIGSVVDHKGHPMSGVAVSVNGVARAMTDASGEYRLEALEAGRYRLSASLAHTHFESVEAAVAAGTASLPALVAVRYDVCGAFERCAGPTCTVTATGGSAPVSVAADREGAWCLQLAPGQYTLRAHVPADRAVADSERPVAVDGPVAGILFKTARVRVSGRVACVGTVCDPRVFIKDVKPVVQAKVDAEGRFEFTDVLPGRYVIGVEREGWCWAAEDQEITVAEKDVGNVVFTQTGFAMSIEVSHPGTSVAIELAETSDAPREMSLSQGPNRFCVKRAGVYHVHPRGCMRFEHPSYEFVTAAPKPIVLRVTAFVVRGELHIRDQHANLAVRVRDTATNTVSQANVKPAGSSGKYEIEFTAAGGSELEFVPSADGVLFYPQSRVVRVPQNTCPSPVAAFEGRAGRVIHGKISPALAGVSVVIRDSASGATVGETLSDEKGAYSFGPLYDDRQYALMASMEGYQITPQGETNFRAVQLAGVTIAVKDTEGRPVVGVLVSLSTDGYSTNQLTNAEGMLTVTGVRPGNYFVRPVLKEYVFEPSSLSIDLQEGRRDTGRFTARRVAFSCYGTVRGLDGQPVSNAVVEAVSAKGLFEETRTGEDGRFRIRGLPPHDSYTVSLNAERSPAVERAVPAAMTVMVSVGDVDGISFVTVPRTDSHTVLGRVLAEPQHLSQLTAELTAAGQSVVLQSAPVSIAGLFEFKNVPAGTYWVSLRAGQGLRALRTVTQPAEGTAASGNPSAAELTLPGSGVVQLHFTASARSLPSDVAPPSVVSLVLLGLLALAVYRRQDTLALASQAVDKARQLLLRNSPDAALRRRTVKNTSVRGTNKK